jgi:hypothetical protein
LLSGYRPEAPATSENQRQPATTSDNPGGPHREERIHCPPGGCT